MGLSETLNKIRQILNLGNECQPTVIWSGNGYHIYLVLDAFVLEVEDVFNNNRFGHQPSQKFLRFAEYYLSNGKCDLQHNKTVSFKNCMLRVPGSVNSKNGQPVKIIQKWNGCYKAPINYMLQDFRRYLIDQWMKEQQQLVKIHVRLKYRSGKSNLRNYFVTNNNIDSSNGVISWIEMLLRTPLCDYRKYSIWRILAPYLINVRRLSYDYVIKNWCDNCNKLQRLNFNVRARINAVLKSVGGYRPISLDNLRTENGEIYDIVVNRIEAELRVRQTNEKPAGKFCAYRRFR
jgi:hypothetical protein